MKKTVDWFITKTCYSHKCIFCYAPYDAFPKDASFEEAMQICDEIHSKGIEYVTLCGGEPLLYPYIEEVINKLYGYGVKIILNTGLVANFDVLKVAHKLHILSIPIEGISDEICSVLRGQNVFKHVKRILDYYKTAGLDGLKIKIGTVVNRINIGEIELIYRFLLEYADVVDIWRLYMFSPYGIGAKNRDRLLIDNSEYVSATSCVLNLAKADGLPFSISTRSREDNKGYCFVMDSIGNFYRYEEEYIPLGVNIFNDYDVIISKYDTTLNAKQKEWQY